jgi:hypothetical protein
MARKPRLCPNCGGIPNILERIHEPETGYYLGAVNCPKCLITALGDTTQMAIEAWEVACEEIEREGNDDK